MRHARPYRPGRPAALAALRAGAVAFLASAQTATAQTEPDAPAAIEARITEKLETRAFVSMADGWVVELEETARRTRGPGTEIVSRKVSRQGPRACSDASRPARPKLMRVRKTMPSGTLHQRLMAPP